MISSGPHYINSVSPFRYEKVFARDFNYLIKLYMQRSASVIGYSFMWFIYIPYFNDFTNTERCKNHRKYLFQWKEVFASVLIISLELCVETSASLTD